MKEKIESLIKSNDVFLFMKGDKEQPMCRFSATVVSILNQLETDFETFNVLEDMEMREAVKQYANWPTYPQLYVKGEFVGGCDIIVEMFDKGELESVIKG